MPLRRRAVLVLPPALLVGAGARAEERPAEQRPVLLVAPHAAGAAADIAARNFAAHAVRHMAESAHPIVVENRAGASGALGTQAVAQATPDGHTLLLARTGASAILPAMDPRTPYGVDDFTWLGLLDENPFVICVAANAPWGTLTDLLGALRAGSLRLRFATAGPATILDIGVRHMLGVAGLGIDAADATPTRGGAEALAALLAGEADFIGNSLAELSRALTEGSIRVLAVAGTERLAFRPEVPTTAEAGLPDMAPLTGWNALAAPAGLPDPLRGFWEGVVARTGQDPDWLLATHAVGSIPRLTAGAEARAHVLAQIDLYRDLARRLNLG